MSRAVKLTCTDGVAIWIRTDRIAYVWESDGVSMVREVLDDEKSCIWRVIESADDVARLVWPDLDAKPAPTVSDEDIATISSLVRMEGGTDDREAWPRILAALGR